MPKQKTQANIRLHTILFVADGSMSVGTTFIHSFVWRLATRASKNVQRWTETEQAKTQKGDIQIRDTFLTTCPPPLCDIVLMTVLYVDFLNIKL